MRRKLKEFMTELLAGLVLLTLLYSFVLSFIFVEKHFLTCIWVGILATITFAALCWGKDIVRG